MNDAHVTIASEKELVAAARSKVTVFDIFLQFLIIGATSFGGVVPYLREGLITKNHWVDDKEFVELLSISQSLPGLNATNMAVLLGDRLKGWLGAIMGIVGVCLPGAAIMFAVAVAPIDPGWASVGFSWSVAGRNYKHGQRSRHGLDDRRHCNRCAAHYVVAQNKSRTARARGSHCGWHCLYAQVSRGAVLSRASRAGSLETGGCDAF